VSGRESSAIAESKGDPANYLTAVRYIETLKEILPGKDNRIAGGAVFCRAPIFISANEPESGLGQIQRGRMHGLRC